MPSPISTLNFATLTSNHRAFVNSVRFSLTTTGFFLLENHGISASLLFENERLFDKFFRELTLEQRMAYAFPEEHYGKGYTPPNLETGEYAKVPDYKHFFQFGADGDPRDMLYVAEIPELREVSKALYREFASLYQTLMGVIALTLGFEREYFDGQLGNSIVRRIHYPAHASPVTQDSDVEEVRGGNAAGMCASRHTDINDLTLLHATKPGLQLLHKGEWVPVLCSADTIIVNAGDMLWHLTGGRYKSGSHRVVCEPGVDRTSAPFFGHRKDECSVVPLPQLGESDLNVFHFKTEVEFLAHRIQQIIGGK